MSGPSYGELPSPLTTAQQRFVDAMLVSPIRTRGDGALLRAGGWAVARALIVAGEAEYVRSNKVIVGLRITPLGRKRAATRRKGWCSR
jgi:hypothetical protein